MLFLLSGDGREFMLYVGTDNGTPPGVRPWTYSMALSQNGVTNESQKCIVLSSFARLSSFLIKVGGNQITSLFFLNKEAKQ